LKPTARRLTNIPQSGIRKFFDMARKYPDVISLGAGEPDFTTPQHIIEAGIEALRRGYTHYTGNLGDPDLRNAIAEKLRSDNRLYYSPDEILVTMGSSEALSIVLQAIVDPGSEVLLPDPSYVAYAPAIRLAEGIPVSIPTTASKGWVPDSEELEAGITNHTKAIIVPSPCNPTGAVYPRSTIEEIAELAIRHDLYAISDEIYEKITYEGSTHTSIASIENMRDRTFLINGFSKAYAMTGWRIGYVACPTPLMNELLKIHQYCAICAPAASQRAAYAALTGPQDCIREMVREYDRRRIMMVHELNKIDGISCQAPLGTFYVFPSIEDLMKEKGRSVKNFLQDHGRVAQSISEQMMDYLFLSAHVVSVGGNIFGAAGEGYMRMSFATGYEKIVEAIKRVKDAVSRL
jgi:aminotransferase